MCVCVFVCVWERERKKSVASNIAHADLSAGRQACAGQQAGPRVSLLPVISAS